MKKILITGGLGYIGSKLSIYLLNKGYKIRILDINYFGYEHLNDYIKKKKIELIIGDISSSQKLKLALKNIDAVIHLAAISDDPTVELDRSLSEATNFHASLKLLKLSESFGIKRFIFASSSTVYGAKKESKVHEKLKLEPISLYGKFKAMFEPYLIKANKKSFQTVSLRPGTVCGISPRQRFDVLVNILTINALINKKIVINGGEQMRTNIHIDDMINIYHIVLEANEKLISGEIFNVSFENFSVVDTALLIKKIIKDDIEIEIKKETIDKRSYKLDSSKFIKRFAYKPTKSIEDAVNEIQKKFNDGHFRDGIINDNYYDIRALKKIFYKKA